jgi:hypothetical protein
MLMTFITVCVYHEYWHDIHISTPVLASSAWTLSMRVLYMWLCHYVGFLAVCLNSVNYTPLEQFCCSLLFTVRYLLSPFWPVYTYCRLCLHTALVYCSVWMGAYVFVSVYCAFPVVLLHLHLFLFLTYLCFICCCSVLFLWSAHIVLCVSLCTNLCFTVLHYLNMG